MGLWNAWPDFLQSILHTLAISWGLGTGLAIIILAVGVRATLTPLTWSLAYRSAVRQSKLASLEPALKALRARYAHDPHTQMQKTLELYRQHGLKMADGKSLFGALVQIPVIYGLYRVLSQGVGANGFLWVRNLARPDALLAMLAALTTAAMMAVAPHSSEQLRLVLILLPAIVRFLAALHVSSGIALYWITSNLIGTAQTLALRQTLKYRGLH
jgi:YidC/Oxa1 family membrane protein insertase